MIEYSIQVHTKREGQPLGSTGRKLVFAINDERHENEFSDEQFLEIAEVTLRDGANTFSGIVAAACEIKGYEVIVEKRA